VKDTGLPWGKETILSCTSAALAAATICFSVDAVLPYAMLYFISEWKSTVSWGTMPICFLSEFWVT